METSERRVDLGFTEARLPPGTHICQIYGGEEERSSSLLQYLLSGVRQGEGSACFTEKTSAEAARAFFRQHGEDFDAALASGELTLSTIQDIYFQNGEFNPDRMLALLEAFHDATVAAGRTAARVIGEMSPQIHSIPGGSRLVEYESRVNELLRRIPVTAVCQYDARAFDGGTILEVLQVHPMMVVRGAVVHNPFFIPPASN